MGNDRYFLDKSYFHLYTYNNDLKEFEYILLHCDTSEPNDTPHSIYKKSPHLHIEVAEHPIPKAHFALYNGRVAEVLRNIKAYNIALSETKK
ncbi:MAG: hypothetical protein JWP81_884 [Ferruginibacter sp.]|nr:hypothetical protein [Ferruginibacter sp.]